MRVESTTEVSADAVDEGVYQRLLTAARDVVHCDAAALLRLDGEVLTPVAVDGLSAEALGRRFPIVAHRRFALLLESGMGLRFEPDCGLPDPYDGLVAGQPELLAVHDCMGAPLRIDGRTWGLLTLDALQARAFDAVTPLQLQALVKLIESGIEGAHTIRAMRERAAREQAVARAWQSARRAPRELLGTSPAMQRLRGEIDTVAASDLTVLLVGETGVGKDLVAQRLHARSRRQEQPLVQVNCAALPEALADSELFGHKKGAFTGAVQDRSGKFELADGGTLFLDEVGELAPSVQAKLLRVLQSGEVQRPGSDRTHKVDVRVIAATNRDLRAAISQGRFRADLYHRLSVYPLVVPPLRERGRDVLTLAGGFLEENQHRIGARNLRLTPAAKSELLSYSWPGNVRELEHLVSRAALRAFSEHPRGARWMAIEPRHLALERTAGPAVCDPAAHTHPPARPYHSSSALHEMTLRDATDAFQREWLSAALSRHEGHMGRAAKAAGMDRSNFHRLLKRLGVQLPVGPKAVPALDALYLPNDRS